MVHSDLPVVGHRKLFLVHLAQTRRSKRTALADLAQCPIRILVGLGATIQEYFPERDNLTLGAQIMIILDQ